MMLGLEESTSRLLSCRVANTWPLSTNLIMFNWLSYVVLQHGLHERMRPWISKKITEFLGEEETSLVDYIVTSTQEHVKAAEMLETLKSILDEEAEMFVLKMWRMLIFEIKKVETGLHLRSRS